MLRLISFIAYCATCVALFFLLVSVIPEMETAYTNRFNAYQQQETLRTQAREETAQAWAAQLGDTARTWAWPAAIGAILIVAAVQAGRTLRHRETEVTRRRALLALYMARMLPPGSNAQIGTWQGQLAVINHDDEDGIEIIPWEVAQIEMSAARLLTDQNRGNHDNT